MIYRIVHTTRFTYDQPAYESHNEVRLEPRDGLGQRVVAFRLDVDPPAAMIAFDDAYGNRVQAISVTPPHETLTIVARSGVEPVPRPPARVRDVPLDEFLAEDLARTSERYDFLSPTRYVPFGERLRKFFWSVRPGRAEGVGEYTDRVMRSVRDQFEYEPGTTHVHSTVDDILAEGGGVCQDFAHLALGVLRLAGIPARYVSGYLVPPDDPSGGRAPVGEQASHGWIEVLLPGQDWVGFDPTHRCRTGERHLRVAVGRDYADVPPVRGVYRSRGTRQWMNIALELEADAGLPEGAEQ
ncbi:MAG TPA: transglutaminase family protein [Candidatus Binatus sp.]|nr:transglutaminase family protein [Candidatus Binatus sp.]